MTVYTGVAMPRRLSTELDFILRFDPAAEEADEEGDYGYYDAQPLSSWTIHLAVCRQLDLDIDENDEVTALTGRLFDELEEIVKRGAPHASSSPAGTSMIRRARSSGLNSGP